MIQLGPFDLEEPAGKGAMAAVWRARHRTTNTVVGVKVLTAQAARNTRISSLFKNEVRAVAGLNHRHVVTVFDYGLVNQIAEERSGGSLVADSPFLAMEWASGGTLRENPPKIWSELQGMLVALLDALAHAHARDVIHRDVKPANVLLCGDVVKLADFGIAHLLDASGVQTGAGTPAFMAPEQFDRSAGEQGPWTDLYALGCTAFELVTGALPFELREEAGGIVVDRKRPVMAPRFVVPEGFEQWLLRMLHPGPLVRFVRAADAKAELCGLPEVWERAVPPSGDLGSPFESRAKGSGMHTTSPSSPEAIAHSGDEQRTAPPGDGTVPSAPARRKRSTDQGYWESGAITQVAGDSHGSPPTRGGTMDGVSELVPLPEWIAQPDSAEPTVRIERLPFPADWRQIEAEEDNLHGVGLGLFGLRSIPMVDRKLERDRLWQALAAVSRERRARMVVLQGPSGCGRTRLGRWIAARAHELGVATTMSASFAAHAGPSDGLAPMVARHLQCVGLDRASALRWVTARLGPGTESQECVAVTELVSPSKDRTFFSDAEERYAVVEHLCAKLSQTRPVLLWLDDVEWGLPGLRLAQRILDAQAELATSVLIVAACSEERLALRDAERKQLSTLLARDDVSTVTVGPLARADHDTLVRRHLGLEGELVDDIVSRTDGNALFAVQLVGECIAHGELELGPRGFRLAKGRQISLPSDLAEVWRARVIALLRGTSAQEQHALEIAAALGQEVATSEWAAVCKRLRLGLPVELLEVLLKQRLADANARGPSFGWSFVHNMLREAIAELARDAGRLEAHHTICAEVLAEREADLERIARHLLKAGHADGALTPLLEAAERHLQERDFSHALVLLAERERAIDSLGLPEDDRQRVRGWIPRCHALRLAGRHEEVAEWARKADRAAAAHGWDVMRADALGQLGLSVLEVGDRHDSIRLLKQSFEILERHGDDARIARAHRALGDMWRQFGEAQRAMKHYEAARPLCVTAEDDSGLGGCFMGMGITARNSGDLPAAKRHLERAAKVLARCSVRSHALAINALADVHRTLGESGEAEDLYRMAASVLRSLGSVHAVFPEVNRGLLLVHAGDATAARATLLPALRTVTARGMGAMSGATELALAACAARLREWETFDGHLERSTELLDSSGYVDPDIANVAELASSSAKDAGEYDRAFKALRAAEKQWTALGRDADMDRVRESLRVLRLPS